MDRDLWREKTIIDAAETKRQAEYCTHFANVYREKNGKYLQEAKCLKMQTNHILVDMDKGDLIVGQMRYEIVGFSPQYGGFYTYYFNEKVARDILSAYPEDWGKNQEFLETVSY